MTRRFDFWLLDTFAGMSEPLPFQNLRQINGNLLRLVVLVLTLEAWVLVERLNWFAVRSELQVSLFALCCFLASSQQESSSVSKIIESWSTVHNTGE